MVVELVSSEALAETVSPTGYGSDKSEDGSDESGDEEAADKELGNDSRDTPYGDEMEIPEERGGSKEDVMDTHDEAEGSQDAD